MPARVEVKLGVRSQKWKCSGRREGGCLVGHRKGDSHTSGREKEETWDPAKGAGGVGVDLASPRSPRAGG